MPGTPAGNVARRQVRPESWLKARNPRPKGPPLAPATQHAVGVGQARALTTVPAAKGVDRQVVPASSVETESDCDVSQLLPTAMHCRGAGQATAARGGMPGGTGRERQTLPPSVVDKAAP